MKNNHVVRYTDNDNDGNLRDKTGNAKLTNSSCNPAVQPKTLLLKTEGFGLLKIRRRHDAGSNLSNNGGNCGAFDPHMKNEDRNWI